tara:strand:+ start:1253 stop:1441 length:189 start_codon:yes stop_codon:yes gene_type:complete
MSINREIYNKKFKSVSIREDNLKEIDSLSKTLLPKVNLSKAQTIAKVLDIAKNTLEKKYDRF